MGESLMIILRWGRTVDQKMEAMHGTLCTIPPATVTNNMNIISYNFMDFPLHGTIFTFHRFCEPDYSCCVVHLTQLMALQDNHVESSHLHIARPKYPLCNSPCVTAEVALSTSSL
jgi:hypothetical protein